MQTFSHSGDLGDIIYSLPTVAALGGGHLILGQRVKVRAPMTVSHFRNIEPLLRVQPYLGKVSFSVASPENVDYNLDEFRRYWARHLCYGKSIAQFHAETFSVKLAPDTSPWLHVDKASKPYSKLVVIARSARYRNALFPWHKVVEAYRNYALFVGTTQEFDDFTGQFGPLIYYPTQDLLSMARIIAACDLFVGNQSCPYAIAEGLKKHCIQEVHLADPNCMFKRSDVQYVAGRHILLPSL